MKFWVLVGEGPNDVEIPALIFTDEKVALKRCTEIFGCEPKIHSAPSLSDSKIESQYYRWHHDDVRTLFGAEVVEQVYTSYYGGCGEFYAATLMEVEEGKPFVCFNLD